MADSDGPPGAPITQGTDGAGQNGADGDGGPEEKVTRDSLKLIDAIRGIENRGEDQSLRSIAEETGLSKDEVNRYLNPEVRELYTLERLLFVRESNRSLYNYLIVSGPPRQEDGEWVGIEANTSKYEVFEAVCERYGYDLTYVGERGKIVDLEYQGIEEMALDRMGKSFDTQGPVLELEELEGLEEAS
jgi:hypothetical protein